MQLAAKSRINAIGLLFDAETDRKKTRTKLRRMFLEAEVPVPVSADAVRVHSIRGVPIRMAYHINPAKKRTGALEALFTPQVRRAEVGHCIGDLLKCYQKEKRLTKVKRDKVYVRTYLAFQNPSNTGLDTALDRGFLSCDGAEFNAIKRFVALLKPKPTPLLNGLSTED